MQSRRQFAQIKRLGHVVVSALAQAREPVIHGIPGGQYQHGQARFNGSHGREQFHSVTVRKPQVEHQGTEGVFRLGGFGVYGRANVVHRDAMRA